MDLCEFKRSRYEFTGKHGNGLKVKRWECCRPAVGSLMVRDNVSGKDEKVCLCRHHLNKVRKLQELKVTRL